jgi:hypothetical protein
MGCSPIQIPTPGAFAAAIADCETGHIPEEDRDTALGDGGAALGRYQIHRIFVAECNRILRRKAYTDADRADPVKAREMTLIHASYYYARLPEEHRTLRNAARIHNGGPRGWTRNATLGYAEKFDFLFSRHAAGGAR